MNTSNSLKDLPLLMEKSKPTPADNMEEVVRLIREIHAAVCSKAPEPAPKPRIWLEDKVMEVFEDGNGYSPFLVWQKLVAMGMDCKEPSVAATFSRLWRDDKLTRPRRNLYYKAGCEPAGSLTE